MNWNVVALAFAPVVLATAWVLFRFNQNRRRFRAITRFLDHADGLESELADCQSRMQALQEWVSKLPNEGSRAASDRLDPAESVQNARKQLLAQRLWLKANAESTSIAEIDKASERIAKSRASLAEQMTKLEGMSDELKRAAAQQQVKNRQIEVEGHNHTLH
jgi:chromosome segregation ATPase